MSFLLLLEIDAINRFYLVKSVLSHELSVRFMKTEPPLFHEICIRPVWAYSVEKLAEIAKIVGRNSCE